MPDLQAFADATLPLLAALVLGGLLGLDREIRGRWAGLRTHILVALGAALLMSVSVAVPGSSDQIGRVIQGIATGVGFIGAGTILKRSEQMEVKGLTTASSIWLVAGVGIAAGLKLYLLAVSGTAIALLVLTVIGSLEKSAEKGEGKKSQKESKDEKKPSAQPVLSA